MTKGIENQSLTLILLRFLSAKALSLSLFMRQLLNTINNSILASALSSLSLWFLFLQREMAMQTPCSSPAHSAQLVGNAFAEKYYKVLLSDPDIVYKFYEDSSVLSRPDHDGMMTSVTTMEGIRDKILSLDYIRNKVGITTVDAQDSFEEGVIVLVTGNLTGKDNVQRSFAQTFFLARHAKGYYVLNDVFRFVDVVEAVTTSSVNDANENVASTPFTPKHGQSHRSPFGEEVTSNEKEVCDTLDMKGSVYGNSSVVEVAVSKKPHSLSQNNGHTVAKSASINQEDTKKMSYASIVAKESTVTTPDKISTDAPVIVIAPSRTHQQQQKALKASTPSTNTAPQNNTAKGIFVGNLPSNVSIKELDAIFTKFGPIKNRGIQIRNYEDGFCYGFIEFESSNSARNAIEAHNITIGSNEAYISEKRSTNQASSGRGRFLSGKGEVRNDNHRRSRESSVEGWRDRHGNRGEFSGHNQGGESSVEGWRYQRQNRGRTGRSGEAHSKFYQDGGRRPSRSSSMN